MDFGKQTRFGWLNVKFYECGAGSSTAARTLLFAPRRDESNLKEVLQSFTIKRLPKTSGRQRIPQQHSTNLFTR